VDGLRAHGNQYKLPTDWFSSFITEIDVREIQIGKCYRYGELITGT
jgi:hypothetical protein